MKHKVIYEGGLTIMSCKYGVVVITQKRDPRRKLLGKPKVTTNTGKSCLIRWFMAREAMKHV